MTDSTKYQGLSSLEIFWFEQNQKLIANEGFLEDFGNLFDDKLFFKHTQGKTELDFSNFELEHINICAPATITLSGKNYPLTLKEYAKLIRMSLTT